ncbi:hypothetical protein PPERSA_07459 [Pseudocohnilembus persalinus]|uniref:Uncharacterized protein n=1 Tax=Pseudocohnilembus persalinus TaxID=266149 RepID=A0A0V0QAK2_PSEPJ|nr:hypothetical protein PPERSA_07459 [Pseudocohnilembus persalinus]|eukprot:KRW99216.1 hypothetical protein PPERSA_07459 [Pseudocohnilembus persalinus]
MQKQLNKLSSIWLKNYGEKLLPYQQLNKPSQMFLQDEENQYFSKQQYINQSAENLPQEEFFDYFQSYYSFQDSLKELQEKNFKLIQEKIFQERNFNEQIDDDKLQEINKNYDKMAKLENSPVVKFFESIDGRLYIIIASVHGFQEYGRKVIEIMSQFKPDSVVLEYCESRLDLLDQEQKSLQSEKYYQILKENPNSLKQVGVKDSCLQVKIPDTIIMKGSNLLVWYFTSKKNGQILIRKDYQLTKEKVLQSFTKKVSKSGICAQYMYQKNEKFEMIKDKSDEKLKDDDELVIEYFNKEQLEQFLYEQENYEKENKNKKEEEKVKQKERPPRGILQKFIDPFGENQTVIQAIWSPQLCIFQKRLNYKNLYDQRWDPYERLVTFDGAEVYSRTVPLRGKIISQEMRKLCKNIAERVSLVSFDSYSLKRMVLYFKPDKNNVLHFLYCTSSRLEKEIPDPEKIDTKKLHHTPMVIEGSQFVRPEYVKLTYTTNTMRPVKLTNEIECLNCKNLVQKTDLVDVEYKFIVETLKSQINQSYKTQIEVLQPREEQFVYDRQQIQKEFINGVQEDIPPFIKKLYPKITLEFYKEISKHKHFLSKQVLLCLSCYEDFVKKDPKSGFPREKQQDLRFVKKGMADKKSIFQKKDIKQIVAKKNMEMAQTNISKFQKPDVYQNIIDSLQDLVLKQFKREFKVQKLQFGILQQQYELKNKQ